jgi:hypothetical protein
MMREADIAQLVRKLAKALDVEEKTASRLATGSWDTLEKIDAGMSPTIRRANQIILRTSELWPKGLPWPEGIERPQPDKTPTRAA